MNDEAGTTDRSLEAESCLIAPKRGWLSIEQAVFYFTPYFTGRGKDWAQAIARIAESHIDDYKLDADCEEYNLIITEEEFFRARVGDLELFINPQTMKFILRACSHPYTRIFKTATNLITPPGDFANAYKKLQIMPSLAKAGEALCRLASSLNLYFNDLDRAIEQGDAVVMARQASPLAPFSKIYPDQWRYFTRSKDKISCAEGPNGEKLYSLFIAPEPKKTTSKAIQATIRPETECKKWLTSLMEGSRDVRINTKQNLLREAKKLFPNLNNSGFERAWYDAIGTAKSDAWKRPGRPRKSPR